MKLILELSEKKKKQSSFLEACCETLKGRGNGIEIEVKSGKEVLKCFRGEKKGKKETCILEDKKVKIKISGYRWKGESLPEVAFFILWGLRRIKERERVRRRETEFITLYEAGKMLTSSLNIISIQQKTVEAITSLVECEVGSLLLLDEDRKELYFQVALGEKGEKVKEIRLKVGEGLAGWVAKEGKSIIVNNVEKDPRWFRDADKRSRFKTKSVLCVPVKSRDKILGVLQAINKKKGRFTKRDLELLELMSNQLSVAIENANLFTEIKSLFFETSQALAEAIEMRDPYTGGHTRRVMEYSVAIGKELGLSQNSIDKLKIAAILHDIGKIGIEDRILRKKGYLTPSELSKMKLHPVIGEEIVAKVHSLKDVAQVIRSHQEMFDGKGYPDGLKGDEIPIYARIIAVADTFDALTTDRPYRKGLPFDEAFKIIIKSKMTQFDPTIVDAFVSAYEKGLISNKTHRS